MHGVADAAPAAAAIQRDPSPPVNPFKIQLVLPPSEEAEELAEEPTGKTLIVVTGDTSDVDGFQELAYYFKHTNADVMFIMNYPQYVSLEKGVKDAVAGDPYRGELGRGYKYDLGEMDAERDDSTDKKKMKFEPFLTEYRDSGYANPPKTALTNLAYKIVSKLWDEERSNDAKGSLHFCVGGVNLLNPFSPTLFKNELQIFDELTKGLLKAPESLLIAEEGFMITNVGGAAGESHVKVFDFSQYEEVFLSFTGAASFWNDDWKAKLSELGGKFKGMFILGGVLADHKPDTMSAAPTLINRYSCATMNQLYHPEKTEQLLSFVKGNVPMFIVTNNASGKPFPTKEAVKTALTESEVTDDFLMELSDAFYTIHDNSLKPFDFYVAHAVAQAVTNPKKISLLKQHPVSLFFNSKFGATIIAEQGKTVEQVTRQLSESLKVKAQGMTADNLREMKNALLAEADVVLRLANFKKFEGFELRFKLGENMLKHLGGPEAVKTTTPVPSTVPTDTKTVAELEAEHKEEVKKMKKEGDQKSLKVGLLIGLGVPSLFGLIFLVLIKMKVIAVGAAVAAPIEVSV